MTIITIVQQLQATIDSSQLDLYQLRKDNIIVIQVDNFSKNTRKITYPILQFMTFFIYLFSLSKLVLSNFPHSQIQIPQPITHVQLIICRTMKEQKQPHYSPCQPPQSHSQMERSPQKSLQALDKEIVEGRWSNEEHDLFLIGLIKYGKDWKELEKDIKSRTSSQVRSHAQKYFLKLSKIQKQRRKSKSKVSNGPTEIEKQILSLFSLSDVTEKTPSEIIVVLKREFSSKKGKLFKSSEQSHNQFQSPKKNQIIPVKENDRKNVKNNDQSFLAAYEDQEDESYLLSIMKNHKILEGKMQFKDLIDFGQVLIGQPENHETGFNKHNDHLIQEQAEIAGRRKKSFTLFEENQAEQKLQITLEKVRKGE